MDKSTYAATVAAINWSEYRNIARNMLFQSDTLINIVENAVKASVETDHIVGVLLHGPGGYGKTYAVKKLLKILFPETFQNTHYTGVSRSTTVDDLFGGGKYQDGQISIQFEQGFAEQWTWLLDEAFDATSPVLEALKVAMTETSLCVQQLCYTRQTKVLFVATNKNPDVWLSTADPAEYDSYKALLDRFPYKLRVEWSDKSLSAYKQFSAEYCKYQMPVELEFIIEELLRENIEISPRTYREHILSAYRQGGIKGLSLIDLGSKAKDSFVKILNWVEEEGIAVKLLNEIEKEVNIDSITKMKVDPSQIIKKMTTVTNLNSELEKLRIRYNAPKGIYQKIETAKTLLMRASIELHQKALKVL